MHHDVFPVTGMNCTACAVHVAKALRSVDGVSKADVNFASGLATVDFDCSTAALRKAVAEAGYCLITDPGEQLEMQRRKEFLNLRERTLVALALFLIILFTPIAIAQAVISTVCVFYCGRSFFINAWRNLLHRATTMDTLVALSVGIAYVYSLLNLVFPLSHVYFESSCAIIAFILLGRLLESRAVGRTRRAVDELIKLQPNTCTLLTAAGSRTVDTSEVKAGQQVLIKPGETVPLDGTITGGESYVDESLLSGESIPVAKAQGDRVFAGTLNDKGTLTVTVAHTAEESILANIIRLTRTASESRPEIQDVVDRVAAVFVPAVVGLSVITLIVWLLVGYPSQALVCMMSVLIIACPCALGLATPTALMVGIGCGARQGILIRDATALQNASLTTDIVFDKTGTLTTGRPHVAYWMDAETGEISKDPTALPPHLLALEAASSHPLAVAFPKPQDNITFDSIQTIVGKGITARKDDHIHSIGNTDLLGVSKPQQWMEWEACGLTVVGYSVDNRLVCIVAVGDSPRTEAAEVILTLKAKNINSHLLSGDSRSAAEAIGKKLLIDNANGEVLPEQKVEYIRKLQSRASHVLMIGDGINDGAALATADVGVAMGQGSNVAINAAGVVIMRSDLRKVVDLIDLSRLTMRTIRRNLFWAFIYNVIAIPVAAGVLYPIGVMINPMIGSAAMALSSVCVVTNSLLINRWKSCGKRALNTVDK